MKRAATVLLGAAASVLLSPAQAGAAADAVSPIEKVLQLLSDQQSKVSAEAAEAKKLYEEASKWCVERSEGLKFEIKTAESTVTDLKAAIEQETALIDSLTTKVQELGSSVSSQDADLKAATTVRDREEAEFVAEEKELTEAIDTLKRAVSILEREARKGGAALVQLKGASSLAQVFSTMMDASMITSDDVDQLTSLVQATQNAEEGDLDLGAPQAAAYESKSGGIINTLKDLADKAQEQLEEARKKATKSRHSYEKLKQSLEDGIRLATKQMDEAKQNIAKSSEKKGLAEGDLAATSKGLAEDKDSLETLHQDCLTKAQDYEAESKAREDELQALGQAKSIIQETTSGAASSTYDLAQVSFVQTGRATLSDAVGMRAVHLVRSLARKDKSQALALLASRMSTTLNVDTSAADPFDKIRGMISDMIAKLESEAGADASKKAYCDKETAEANAKKDDRTNKVNKLATQIEQMSARSAQLKSEVAALQQALAGLASSQAEMDKLRQEEKALFEKSKADLEQGLAGIKAALKVLRDFYGNADAATGGAGSGIIGLLEVVESDFSKGLTEAIASEDKAVVNYVQTSKQNQIEKVAKEQDVAYKNKEAASLDKAAADAKGDHTSVEAELDAVLEYLNKLNEECVAKAEPYAEKAARRANEINGLKEALSVLSDDAALLQKSTRRTLRGVRRHGA